MTTGNEGVNDVNSAVQTQEPEMGEGELQVDADKSDESSTNVAASFFAKNVEKHLQLDKSSKSTHRFIDQTTLLLLWLTLP